MDDSKKILFSPGNRTSYSFENLLGIILHLPNLPLFKKHIDDAIKIEKKKREEFYDMITEDKKIEFINGEIIMQSPVRLEHSIASDLLYRLISTYVDIHSLGKVCHEKILISLSRNDYEPDICFFKKEKSRKFKKEQLKFPAPDLIIEVLSESTTYIDRNVKFDDYCLHKIIEYWIIDPKKNNVEQYILRKGKYILNFNDKKGIMKSEIINGLEFPVSAIFNAKINLKILQKMFQKP